MDPLTVIEFVADKVPYVDSNWDGASTVVRPIAGAVAGALLAGGSGDLVTLTLASDSGIAALAGHLDKAGLRLTVNTSPEPASSVGASVGDVSVAGIAAVASLGRVRRGRRAFRGWVQPA